MSAWEKTKRWVDENRVVSGALAGLAAGTVVPGVGNVVGAVVGAGVGYWSTKEKRDGLQGLPKAGAQSGAEGKPGSDQVDLQGKARGATGK